INPDTNKIPKHLFQGYLNIYNNYFKAPWMPDRTEANPNELNQDDARYGFRCCHLKNIWTAPLPPETELSRQMTDRKSGSAGMPRPISYAVFCLKKKNAQSYEGHSVTTPLQLTVPLSDAYDLLSNVNT